MDGFWAKGRQQQVVIRAILIQLLGVGAQERQEKWLEKCVKSLRLERAARN